MAKIVKEPLKGYNLGADDYITKPFDEEELRWKIKALILQYLCAHKNNLIKREDMLVALWGENDYFLGRSLDVFITKIRKYLKEDSNVNIENVFGVGFIFNVPLEL